MLFYFVHVYSLANSVATINEGRIRSLPTGPHSIGNNNTSLSSNQPSVVQCGLDNGRPKPQVNTATLDTSVQTIIDKMQNGLEVSTI